MSQYRDDQDAARHRLESLEEKLAERDAELEQHKNEIAERDREISRLAQELRSAGTARIVPARRNSGARFMVAGAMSAALVAGLLGFVSVHRTTSMAPDVTFAKLPPPTMPLAAPRLDTDVAPPSDTAAEEAQIRRLQALADDGGASVPELKMLKALCSHLGRQECREHAAALLKEATRPED